MQVLSSSFRSVATWLPLLGGLLLASCSSSSSDQTDKKQTAAADSAAAQSDEAPTPSELLPRPWRLAELDVPTEVPKHQQRLVEVLTKQMTTHHRLTLRPDGRFRRQDPGLGIDEAPIQREGRWRFDSAKSRLVLSNASGYADTLKLLRVSGEALILRTEGPSGSFPQRLTYHPAQDSAGPPS